MVSNRPNGSAVRLCLPSDLPDLRRIIDGTELFPSALIDDMIAPYLGEADESFWLTLAGGSPAGLAYCAPERFTDGTWNLLLIAVHPAAQRRGAGAALIRAVEDGAGARGGRLLLVETSGLPSFEGQRGFYAAQGFAQEARIRDFYQEGEDKIVFWKRLGT